ncbi:MAG: hypothetical protein QOD57_1040 [Actinomycetota bacterium]|jgi:cytochrome P450|nr:hypothetical protein [Actinomycetota bacterium]MDQ1503313.1 hypothetical protein [Actinomycetota bacterium]
MSASEPIGLTDDWDPMTPENYVDPVGVNGTLRRDCPVAHSSQFGGFWALFKRADIVAATKQTDTFVSSPAITVPPFSVADAPWIPLQSDPPQHRQYRRIINPFFFASRLEGFEPELRRLTNDFIDEFIEQGEADLVAELTLRLPATAISLLLGLPLESWKMLHDWTVAIIGAGNRGDFETVGRTYGEMFAFADQLMEARRQKPGEDVMTALVTGEVEGRPLTQAEIRGAFALLIIAGHETTSNAISNALYLFATDHSTAERLRTGGIDDTALEEIVRYCNPVQGMGRTTTRDVEVGGRCIPGGSLVALMFGSGSRDADEFAQPDEFVPERSPNPHLTFGSGQHRCLGEQLARMEIRIVLETVLERLHPIELAGDTKPALWPSIGYHGLPVRFAPGTRRSE